MIEARGLTKRYGDTVAVDGLTFDIRPGVVTGFLGPNGAGKSTTMRMILGLDRPTSGSVHVGGRRYRDLGAPMHEVGALLDAGAVHGKRSARNHLRWLADAGGLPRRRVEEVLDEVGLSDVAGRRVGGFSLGMSQRLGIAVGAAGRPRDAAVRRADERPRPRGHPLDPDAAAALRRRGPHGHRLEPPHARDGGDRRPRARDRARPADRRHQHRRVHPARGGQPRPRRLARRRRARRAARARRRPCHRRRRRRADGRRPARRRGSATSPPSTACACTS